jgi:hypothetical protein
LAGVKRAKTVVSGDNFRPKYIACNIADLQTAFQMQDFSNGTCKLADGKLFLQTATPLIMRSALQRGRKDILFNFPFRERSI